MMGPTETVVSGGVISYNGDSERGWNDPPTLSFNGVTTSKKAPKIDLRKRVSHQEALTGRKITSPSIPNSPNLHNPVHQLTNGVSNLTLAQTNTTFQPVQPSVPPAISPCHSRHSSGSFTPPMASECQNFAGTVQLPSQYPVQSFGPTLSQPSLVDHSSKCGVLMQQPSTTGIPHAMTPTTTSAPKMSSPVTTSLGSSLGQPLFSFPKSLNMMPVSKALDSTFVCSNPDILVDTLHYTPNSVNDSQLSLNTSPVFSSQEIMTAPLIFTPSPTSVNNFASSSNDPVGKQSPVLNRTYLNDSVSKLHTSSPVNGSDRKSPSVSPVPPRHVVNKSPTSTPTGIHSESSTPRSTSPDNRCRSTDSSRHNSEEFDNQEAMKATVEALEETLIKCSNILKSREAEDVKKKLEIMKQQWLDEKLSLPVKMSMKSLAKALLDVDTRTADKLHIQLMVDYVGEVKQWMVAIKRLITAIGNLHMNTTAS